MKWVEDQLTAQDDPKLWEEILAVLSEEFSQRYRGEAGEKESWFLRIGICSHWVCDHIRAAGRPLVDLRYPMDIRAHRSCYQGGLLSSIGRWFSSSMESVGSESQKFLARNRSCFVLQCRHAQPATNRQLFTPCGPRLTNVYFTASGTSIVSGLVSRLRTKGERDESWQRRSCRIGEKMAPWAY